MNLVMRLGSLALLLGLWLLGSHLVGARLLPEPQAVGLAIVQEARSGALEFNLAVTLARVAVSFAIAMLLGTVIGLAMGRIPLFDQFADPWLVVLLNLPALVIIVLAYIWAGLTETAAIAAVALNKLPVAIVTVREGARALDRTLDEMATVFRMSKWARLRHVVLPQLAPYGRGRAFRTVTGVEDRVDRRAAWPAQWRRIRNRRCVPTIRRHAYPRLCSGE